MGLNGLRVEKTSRKDGSVEFGGVITVNRYVVRRLNLRRMNPPVLSRLKKSGGRQRHHRFESRQNPKGDLRQQCPVEPALLGDGDGDIKRGDGREPAEQGQKRMNPSWRFCLRVSAIQ
jgi:hypothetical protein